MQDPEQHALAAVQGAPFAAQVGGAWHVAGLPEQSPVQHSVPDAHVAPFCLQGSAHRPEPSQSPEQQAPGAAGQAFPFVVQGRVQTWVIGSQAPEAQSAGTAQESPTAHVFPCATQDPPQSTSVSVPSFTPSVQLAATQRWVLPSHRPEVQSAGTPQATPFAQVFPSATQAAPPQSTPVSTPFFAPSVQVGCATGSALEPPPPPPHAASARVSAANAARSTRADAERRSSDIRAP